MLTMPPRPLRALLALLFALPITVRAAGLAVERLDATPSTLAAELVKDRVNIVMIWTTHCPVCRSQYPLISAFHDAHRERDAVVLGIALAEAEARTTVAAYRESTAHAFPSVRVSPDVMLDAYAHATGGPFTGTPTYLVLDGAGKLRSYVEGPTTEAQLAELVQRFGADAQP